MFSVFLLNFVIRQPNRTGILPSVLTKYNSVKGLKGWTFKVQRYHICTSKFKLVWL